MLLPDDHRHGNDSGYRQAKNGPTKERMVQLARLAVEFGLAGN